jgi:hypothetical protein
MSFGETYFLFTCSFELITFCTQKSQCWLRALHCAKRKRRVRPSHKYVCTHIVSWRQKTFNFEINCLVMLESCSFSAAGEKFFVSRRVTGSREEALLKLCNAAYRCGTPVSLKFMTCTLHTLKPHSMEGHTHYSLVCACSQKFLPLVCKFTRNTFLNKRKNTRSHQSSSILKHQETAARAEQKTE